MSVLPVSPETFFRDFSDDLIEYTVFRDNAVLARVSGLRNKDRSGLYIHLPVESNVECGDVLVCGSDEFAVSRIEFDTWKGSPALIKAYCSR